MKREHTWYKCPSTCNGCQFCEGGLGACTVCNGAEGTLTIECCGYKLDEHVQAATYSGGLDYAGGEWHVAPTDIAENYARILNWRQGLKVMAEAKHKAELNAKCICQGFFRPRNCPVHGVNS